MSKYVSIETERRLSTWGKWCQLIETWQLGYASQSITNKLILGVCQTLSQSYPENWEAEVINALVEQLNHQHPLQAKVLYIHYAKKGGRFKKAKVLHMSNGTYNNLLYAAEQWIEKHLD